MRKICCVNVCLLLAILCCAGGLCAADASKDSTLNGYFTWPGDKTGARGVSTNKDGKCEIKMVLTPTANANEFKVAYIFTWDGHVQNWNGTFKRDPQNGETAGTAGNGGANWNIKGKTKDGTISCQYFEIKDGKEGAAGGEIVFKT